jgi:hypothetical protein
MARVHRRRGWHGRRHGLAPLHLLVRAGLGIECLLARHPRLLLRLRARVGGRAPGFFLRFLRRLEGFLERLPHAFVVDTRFLQRFRRLALRFLDRSGGFLHRLGRVLRGLALGAQHLDARLSQVGARVVDLFERPLQLLAPRRVLGAVAHLLHDAAREVDGAFGERSIDLALDGAIFLGRLPGLVQVHEVDRRREDGQAHEQDQAPSEEEPPGRAVQEIGDGFHGDGRGTQAPDIIQ